MINNKAVTLSILLSIANITGSSGLTIWIETTLKEGGTILNTYIPIFSYLIGLSIGCMTISFFIRKIKSIFLKENIFILSLLLATINCLLFSKEWMTISVWADAIHRVIWGVMSGFTVILGRNTLITEGNEKKTHKSFSILSLALLCLPFLIPITFSILNLNNRTSADLFSSVIYIISLTIFLFRNKKTTIKKKEELPTTSHKKSNYIVTFSFLNLVTINVCFFLLLMIMPAIRVMYFNYIDMTQMYIILLIIWLPCAIVSKKITKSAKIERKIIIGNMIQLFSLVLCLISINIGSGILYVFFMLLIFLANMIMQPIFFPT
ncbi:MFS transporter [Xenorhabdus taiwanensis]|uniref:MFS transporter n=1 Tax=Xenorhabdus taiwanensis TaxID=3085177 RepID=UPI0035A5EB70